ncbi:unnamed protein product [Adineta ricciae]|uniref:Uncharacterized protein n=1 Tax=Adineta ricciae TaxID=249248 RepID=A0A815LYV3_ADIRI|nr:unnamed protein product [Adineta ricciae]
MEIFGDEYIIEWNGENIVMETNLFSLTTKFHYQNQETILAEFRRCRIPFNWTNRYDLEIFSKQVPHPVYLLALAARDHDISQSSTSSRSSRNMKYDWNFWFSDFFMFNLLF